MSNLLSGGAVLLLVVATVACEGTVDGPPPGAMPDATGLDSAGGDAAGVDGDVRDGGDAAAHDAAPVDAARLDAAPRDGATPSLDATCPPTTPDGGPSGAVHDVYPGDGIAAAVAAASPGDVVVVHGGSYPELRLVDVTPSAAVVVTGAPGDEVTIEGLRIQRSSNLQVRALSVAGFVYLEAVDHVALSDLDVDPGTGSRGNTIDVSHSHDVSVTNSRVARGVRTIVVFSGPIPEPEWTRNVTIAGNELWGGERCVHVIGGTNVTIAHNHCHSLDASAWAVGVQLSGSRDARIVSNVFEGPPGARSGVGITIGKVHEMIEGADHLTVERTYIANNLIHGFAEHGILVEGAADTDIVNCTSWDNGTSSGPRPGLSTNGRAGGNPGLRIWNDLLESIELDPADPPLTLDMHNMVARGDSSPGRIVADPRFVDDVRYELAADSPAIDAGALIAGTPATDLDGLLRVGAPDLGAREQNGAPACE